MDPEARESEAIDFLDDFPRDFGGILIGGYAVSAYGSPRFSVDVDLVLPSRTLESTRSWLQDNRFRVGVTAVGQDPATQLSKFRVSKDGLSVDVFFGGLRSRESGATVDYPWIAKRPRVLRLELTTGHTSSRLSVARPEALWVLKLLAGRAQDISDLFAISSFPIDESEVRSELRALPALGVRRSLRRVMQRVETDEEYVDALSRRALGSPDLLRNRRKWESFRLQVKSVLSWTEP